ncbi:MAG: hypothetical protein EOM19_02200 [Candidatus Moranbacteria bacterium]|nr:hypothetical protein [Candidatus Moranbacteria bacterium]
MDIENILKYKEMKDTRDGTPLNVYKIDNDIKLSRAQYEALKDQMKPLGCYYSRFAGGFICKTKLDNFEKKVEIKKEKSAKVEYKKNVFDYITLEEYKEFLGKKAEENYHNSWSYRRGIFKTTKEAIENYKKELLEVLESSKKYEGHGTLYKIREAILEKSLGNKFETFRTNGTRFYYEAIWDKLPTIEGLELTDETYTAVWGYDQTNVTIAKRLNKKVWGLDAFRDNNGEYHLVRMKDGHFKNKNGVMYFTRDHYPEETFKQDASQTGYYH